MPLGGTTGGRSPKANSKALKKGGGPGGVNKMEQRELFDPPGQNEPDPSVPPTANRNYLQAMRTHLRGRSLLCRLLIRARAVIGQVLPLETVADLVFLCEDEKASPVQLEIAFQTLYDPKFLHGRLDRRGIELYFETSFPDPKEVWCLRLTPYKPGSGPPRPC